MDPEYILSKDEIRGINETQGGSLRTDADIDTALMRGRGKSIHRKVAYLWRAILVGHPFTDGNKRTALMVALAMFERCDIAVDERRKDLMTTEILKIAKENTEDIDSIERVIRYVATGH